MSERYTHAEYQTFRQAARDINSADEQTRVRGQLAMNQLKVVLERGTIADMQERFARGSDATDRPQS